MRGGSINHPLSGVNTRKRKTTYAKPEALRALKGIARESTHRERRGSKEGSSYWLKLFWLIYYKPRCSATHDKAFGREESEPSRPRIGGADHSEERLCKPRVLAVAAHRHAHNEPQFVLKSLDEYMPLLQALF
jgi:hypothetical protein